jgi:protein-S-isoprenylcysteine O-methyltransferase Ste14
MDASTDNPGVRFPPPLLYAAAVIGGWLLDARWPLPITSSSARSALAWLLVAGWAVLAASAVGLFRRQRTSMMPFRPATTLVTRGPYAWTRNPMYVSLAILAVAFAVFLNTWWVVLLLLPVLLAVRQFVILPEEHYLRRRFGAEYEAYTRRVRRWL